MKLNKSHGKLIEHHITPMLAKAITLVAGDHIVVYVGTSEWAQKPATDAELRDVAARLTLGDAA